MRRKTREQKLLEGSYRPDRDRATPRFAATDVKCPSYLSKEAKAEWRRVAPLLDQAGILRPIDRSILSAYCEAWANWRASEDDISRNGLIITVTSQTRTGLTQKPMQNPAVRNSIQYGKMMMTLATKFGLDPLARPRIEVPPDDDNELDPLLAFINDGDDDIYAPVTDPDPE